MSRGEAHRDPCESIAKRDKAEAAPAKPKPKANPDVAKHFNKPSLATAGWHAAANLTALPGGSYAVRVIQVNSDGTGSLYGPQRVLVLNGNLFLTRCQHSTWRPHRGPWMP